MLCVQLRFLISFFLPNPQNIQVRKRSHKAQKKSHPTLLGDSFYYSMDPLTNKNYFFLYKRSSLTFRSLFLRTW